MSLVHANHGVEEVVLVGDGLFSCGADGTAKAMYI
jgi:hypothetical protein